MYIRLVSTCFDNLVPQSPFTCEALERECCFDRGLLLSRRVKLVHVSSPSAASETTIAMKSGFAITYSWYQYFNNIFTKLIVDEKLLREDHSSFVNKTCVMNNLN